MAQPAGVGLAAEYRHTGCYTQRGAHLPGIVRWVKPHSHPLRDKAQVVVSTTLGKVERACPLLFPEGPEPFDIGKLIVLALVAAVFILQLHHEDGATIFAETRNGDFCHLFQIPGLRLHKLLVACVAQRGHVILQQIGGQTTQIPLAAHIGTGAEQHPHALLLAHINERGYIIAATEIPAAIRLLQRVPERVESNRVQPHGLCCANAVAPVLAWHTLRMNLS